MFNATDFERFNKYWDSKLGYLSEVTRILDIYNGNLMPYLMKELQSMFRRPDGTISPTYEQAIDRVVPINILQRIVNKQSKIYNRPPKREVSGGDDDDRDMMDFYVDKMFANRQMGIANQMFSLFNCAIVEPVVKDRRYLLRPYLNSHFLVYSDDSFDPTNPTVVLVYHGMIKNGKGKSVRALRAYSKDSYAVFTDEGILVESAMGDSDGTNPYGELQFEYINRKQQIELIPTLGADTYKMAVLIPLLMSDVAFALKFQAFSIIYGIDIDEQSRPFSPAVMWTFDSDPKKETTPSIGTISPTVDSDKAVAFIQTCLTLWLQTKGIRAGAVGQLNIENFSSGISKMIDEMDTFEDRQEQVTYFTPAEQNLWSRVCKVQHPIWQDNESTEFIGDFTANADASVTFPEQTPRTNRNEVVDVIKKEMDMGLESRRGALARLEPELTEDEIDVKLKEIDDEKLLSPEPENLEA